MQKLLIALAVVASLFVAGSFFESQTPSTGFLSTRKSPVETMFENWMMANNKSYGTDSQKAYRLSVFTSNYARVQSVEKSSTATYKLGLNKFADLTAQEFAAQYLGTKVTQKKSSAKPKVNLNAPKSVDWVTKGAVSDVKDQGQCGSCWAFSTTGAIESANYLNTYEMTLLSEQQLVDCSSAYGNMGCNGGLMDYGFEYAEKTGLTTESSYAYTGETGTCESWKIEDGVKVSSYTDVNADTASLLAAVVQQPVSIAINANPIQLYTSGIYNDWEECEGQLDHGVLMVGYGSDDGEKFWKVKNSWGATWGEEGYFRLARRTSGDGICGCTEAASYPSL